MTLYHVVSYLPISLFLIEEKGNRESRREIWVWQSGRPPCQQSGPHTTKVPKSTNPSPSLGKPHFKGWSFWPLVPVADWPPTNWHNLIYLSWEEEWCEKQITENTDLYQEGEGWKERETEWMTPLARWYLGSIGSAGRKWDEKSGLAELTSE